jgi:hypothetical protein
MAITAFLETPNENLSKLLRLLGVNTAMAREVHIHIMPHEVVVMDIKQYVDVPERDKLMELKHYKLVEIKEKQSTKEMRETALKIAEQQNNRIKVNNQFKKS